MLNSKSILIADDHEVVRSGLRAILESHEGWEVVAEAANGKEAIALAVEKSPNVAIVDYSLPLINGVEVTRNIKIRHVDTEVLIFTMHDSDALVREAFQAGARAFLLKSDAKQHLMAAVESLLNHRPFFTGNISEKMLASYLSLNDGPSVVLSPREKNVIQLISEGHSNKGMSRVLNLSVKTIETHRMHLMARLDLHDVAGVVRYALRTGLISAER